MKKSEYVALDRYEQQRITNIWRRDPFGTGPLEGGVDNKKFLRFDDWLKKHKYKGVKK